MKNDDLALLFRQLSDRRRKGGMTPIIREFKECYHFDVIRYDLLAATSSVGLAPEIHRSASDRRNNKRIRVAREMSLVFPVTNEGLLQDVIRIGIRPGPMTRNEPKPGAIFGQPSLPVTGSGGRGIGH